MNIPTYNDIVNTLFDGIDDLGKAQEKRKQEILAEWETSKNYPRKMKKRVRKDLQLDWNIANYNPFNLD